MPIFSKRAAVAIENAAIAYRKVKELNAVIDESKAIIREEAEIWDAKRPEAERGEKLEFESGEGVAMVTFPKASAKFIKGTNPESLQVVLPAAVWDHLFVRKVCLASEFDEKFDALTKTQQKAVQKVVFWDPAAPSVTLPK